MKSITGDRQPAARAGPCFLLSRRTVTSAVCGLFLIIPCSLCRAADLSITVTASALWTATGIRVAPSDEVLVHDASGSWAWGLGAFTGPDGETRPDLAADEWIQNGQHGQLIAFVG